MKQDLQEAVLPLLARIANQLEIREAPVVVRDYLVVFEDFSGPSLRAERYATRVKAYTSDEAVKQVQQRYQNVFSSLANFLVVPFDEAAHGDYRRLNERVLVIPEAPF